MTSTNFRHIAACCRQAYNGVRRPYQVLHSAFSMSPRETADLIRFFYEDGRIEQRLTDEDLREIFFLLTDVYPEEVDDEPDLVQVMANLSESADVKETTATLSFVLQQLERMFSANSNRVRALVMDALFRRIVSKDIYWLILRMTRQANPFKHRDVVSALSLSHPTLTETRIKRESMFTPLPVLAQRIMDGDELIGVPTIGDKLLLPLPVRWGGKDNGTLPFTTNNWLEVIRGERLILHHDKDFTLIHDPNGADRAKDVGGTGLLEILPYGIYVIENVPQDDFPLTVVDVLRSSKMNNIQDEGLVVRRAWLENECPDLFIKPLIPIANMAQLKSKAPKNGVCFIHNGDGVVSYSNKRDECVRYTTKATGEILRLVGGVWRHDQTRGLVLNTWRVAARDGVDGYYEVGDIGCEPEMERRLGDMTGEGRAVEGELVSMKGSTFVEVIIHFANYSAERGIRIQGVITDLVPNAGLSDVVPVEEVEWLVGGEDE